MEYCIYICGLHKCERKYNNMSVCIIAKHISRSHNFIAHLNFRLSVCGNPKPETEAISDNRL